MLKDKFRLRSNKRIAEVFKNGKCIYGEHIFIKYIPNKQLQPRLAINVNTKLFKLATTRNKIKRLLREAIKQNLTRLPNLDILIITQKSLPTNLTLNKLKKEISTIFKKLSKKK